MVRLKRVVCLDLICVLTFLEADVITDRWGGWGTFEEDRRGTRVDVCNEGAAPVA